jgi:putative DNA primase/helicase
MIDLRTLQRALGGEIYGGQLSCPGPGHSPKDRSLCVRLSGDDFIVYSHAGNDWRDCRDYVRQRLGLPAWQPGDGRDRSVASSRLAAFNRAAVNAESERRPRTQEDLARIARAVAIWNEAVDPRGTRAEQYLASRALALDDDVAGNVLRYHPAVPWREEDTGLTVGVPALVAAFRSVDDGGITGVHRIRVDQLPRWPMTERRMLGIVHRAAVKLDPAGDVLAIGEGIETAMAARRLGQKPAWALGSVGAIAKFPLIDGVHRLAILGETGAASANAIQLCGQRWHRAGRKVQIIMPDVGSDLNDQVMAAAAL